MISTGQANWSLFLINSAVLAVLVGVLYYLVQSLRARQQLGYLGDLRVFRAEIDRVYSLTNLKQRIVKFAVAATNAKSGCLMLVDSSTNRLEADTFVGYGRVHSAERVHSFDVAGLGIAAHVARTRRPFRTGDARKEQEFRPQQGSDLKSLLCVPVATRARLLGVISVDREDPDHFGEDDEHLLVMLANEVASALERAQLLSSLQVVSSALSSTLDLAGVAEVILDQLGVLIEYRKASMQLFRGDDRELIAYRGFTTDEINKWLLRPLSQDRLISRIIASRQPMILSDTASDPDWQARDETVDVRSWVGLPLVYGERVVGLITLDHDEAGHYTERLRELLILLGGQAATAIEDAERMEELRNLYSISLDITRESDLEGLLQTIVKRSAELLRARGGGFYECDFRAQVLRVRVQTGIDPALVGQVLAYGEGMAGRVAQDAKSRTVDNYQECPDAARVYTEGRWAHIFEAVAEVPVKWQDRVIGVLFIVDKARRFTESDIHLLERFAALAAIALNNATSLRQLKGVVDLAFDGIIQVDERGMITHFNPSAERLLGYSAQEVLGTPAFKLYCGGHEEAKKIQEQLEKQEEIRDRKSCVLHKDGREINILFSGALLTDQAGQHIGSVGFFQDMTEVRTLRIITNTSRAAFEAVRHMSEPKELDDLLDTIVTETGRLLDADGASILVQEGDVLVDKAFAGYTEAELRSLSIPVGRGLVGRAMVEQRPIVVLDVRDEPAYIMVSPDVRSELDVPIIGTKGPIGVLHVSSHRVGHFDPDEHHSIELCEVLAGHAAVAIQHLEAVIQQQDIHDRLLRTANAVAAGRLAAGVGHELKNALNSIGLTVSNIGERVGRIQGLPGQKEILDKTGRIEQELKHLADIATRLHSLSQEWEPEKEWTYINEIVRNSLDLLQGTIERRGCTYRLNLDPSLDRPPQGSKGHPVYLDERQIRQVIVNMTLNALDASRRGQRVDYSTCLHREQQRVEIRIQDFGAGIDAETKPNLFKPFFTTKPGGTGLGLYVCDLIVRDKHGGGIEIDTKPGRGTVFSVLLPLEPPS